MTQADPSSESIPTTSADAAASPRSKPPAAPMGALVWLSLIPVVVVVFLWVYSGWREYSKEFGHEKTQGTTLRSDLGIIQIVRWTRTGPTNPMAGETVKGEWNFAGLGNRNAASNDGNATRKVLSIPFWLILTVVAILPIITVARAQLRAKRGFELAAAPIV